MTQPLLSNAKTGGDPHVCARCAAAGPTCCTITPGQEEVCFPLSTIEMDRIREFTPASGWFAQEPNSAAFVDTVAKVFPGEREVVERLFPATKFHFRLAVGRGGSCKFLGDAGCALPREVRPYYCRLFPLWRLEDGFSVLGGDCLAVREAPGTGALMRSLGTSPERAKNLHARLRMAWGLPPAKGMPTAEVSYARPQRAAKSHPQRR